MKKGILRVSLVKSLFSFLPFSVGRGIKGDVEKHYYYKDVPSVEEGKMTENGGGCIITKIE